MEINVRVISKRRNGDTMEFLVSDYRSKQYVISNCHRTESLLWKSKNVRCYIGNIKDGTTNKTGGFRLYPDNIGVIVFR